MVNFMGLFSIDGSGIGLGKEVRDGPPISKIFFKNRNQSSERDRRDSSGRLRHPNLVELDKVYVRLSYPGWQEDYSHAVALAETTIPKKHSPQDERRNNISFKNAIHVLRERQSAHEGDRSHWRLQELDRIRKELTYPGWHHDVMEVEEWHREVAPSTAADVMFQEVLDGFYEQEQLYREQCSEDGGRYDDDDHSSSSVSTSPSANWHNNNNMYTRDFHGYSMRSYEPAEIPIQPRERRAFLAGRQRVLRDMRIIPHKSGGILF